MKRRPISKRVSKKIFRKTAQNIKPVNTAAKPMRGGIRM